MKKVSPEQQALKDLISSLRNKITSVDEQIKEEERVKQRLRQEAEAKISSLNALDDIIAKEQGHGYAAKVYSLIVVVVDLYDLPLHYILSQHARCFTRYFFLIFIATDIFF